MKKSTRTVYFKNSNGLKLSNGNLKIGNDTLILNMGAAYNCPSKRLGFCKLCKECYAYKAEIQYPSVKIYRKSQQMYWLKNSATVIFQDIEQILTTKKRRVNGKLQPLYKSIQYLRINESGDFWSQKCIYKLDFITTMLKSKYGIKTYTYTARQDLDFRGVSFVVKGSSHRNGNNGMTIARPFTDKQLEAFKDWKSLWIDDMQDYFTVCPMDCTKCNLCKVKNNINIVFPLH